MRIDEFRFFSAERGGVPFSWTASPAPEVDPAYKNWVEIITSYGDFEIREIRNQYEKLELVIRGILDECYNNDCELSKAAQAAIADVCYLLKETRINQGVCTKKIINLTPHEIVMVDEDNNVLVRYPSQGVARAASMAMPVGEVNDIPLVEMSYGRPEGLPEPVEGTMLIVSMLTAAAAAEYGRSTDDLLITADLVRDDHGNVIGCRKFSRYHK